MLNTRVVATAIGLALACAFIHVAVADRRSDRERLVRDINDKLKRIASDLSGLEGDSSSSDVGYAMRKADEVKRMLGKLKSVQENDSKAKEMAYRWPGYVDKFKESAKNLERLKDKQRSIDKEAGKCRNTDRKLRAFVDKFVKANDPAGLKQIPAKARSIGRKVYDKRRDTERLKSQMERWYSYSRRFSESSGNWSYVKDKLHNSAYRIFDHWKRRWENMKRQCENLAKGERHPYVERGLRRLQRGSQDRGKIMRTLHDKLKRLASVTRDIHRNRSASPIDRAMSLVKELSSGLKQLESAKGRHREANRIARTWPRFANAARPALKALKQLKALQYRLDKGPNKCQGMERQLRDMARRYERQKDPKDLDKLPAFAKKLADKIKRSLDKANRGKSQMERAHGNARRFSASDGTWRSVQSNIHGSADGMRDYFKKARENVDRACKQLTLGDRHPVVVRVMRKFSNQNNRGKRAAEKAKRARRAAVDKCKQMKSAARERNRELAWHMAQARKIKNKARGWPALVDKLKNRRSKLKSLQTKLGSHVKQCRAALKAYAAADAAWEKIYGR